MHGKPWLNALPVGVVAVVVAGGWARPSSGTGPEVTVPDAYTPVLVSVLG